MKTTEIGWIDTFFEKKQLKSLSVPKKVVPLHPQSREMAKDSGIFAQAESRKNLFLCRVAAEKTDCSKKMRK